MTMGSEKIVWSSKNLIRRDDDYLDASSEQEKDVCVFRKLLIEKLGQEREVVVL